MVTFGKKLEANGLWESSRMMLPQHKDESRKQATPIECPDVKKSESYKECWKFLIIMLYI
jgi:hypothetical protein